jgi:tRNA-dihydrouridine synthase B
VLQMTNADAVMIGRAAQGRPWICREIDYFLRTGSHLESPTVQEVRTLMVEHLEAHYIFYGEYLGVRTARKHIGWYVQNLPGGDDFRQRMNLLDDCQEQIAAVRDFFDFQTTLGERLQYHPPVRGPGARVL